MKSSFPRWLDRLAWFALAIALTASLSSPSPRASPAPPPVREVRGVWLTNVSSGVFFVPWGVNRAVERLSQLNFNTVYPAVWNRGHTFYPSRVAREATGKLEDPFLTVMRGGSDVLAEIVRESHRQGLSVIPWFEYGLIVPGTSPLVQQHPDWLAQNRQGKPTLLKREGEGEFLPKSPSANANPLSQWLQAGYRRRLREQVWLNPFHPEVRQFIKGLILEVVVNYEVDGIQLDDHFGLPVEFGYDPVTVKLYQREQGGKNPPADPRDPQWMRWRAAKLTALMADIVQAVKTVKPEARISLSPNSHHFSYQNFLQDWKGWVARGLVDELVLQVYRDDLEGLRADLQEPAVQFARRQIPVSAGILSGTWTRPVGIGQIQEQVKLVRDLGLDGVSFFYWETLWGYLTPDSPRQRRQTFRTLFAQPALRPTVARASPPSSHDRDLSS